MALLQQDEITQALRNALQEAGLEPPDSIALNRIPFSGRWGWGSPLCFQMASAERKAGKQVQVNQRAQEIAEQVCQRLREGRSFSQVEAARGYINVFFDAGQAADQLVRSALEQQGDFGRGQPKGERVMVEYSQPNTHKAFHVGHLRNVCLGHSLSNLLDFAGFEALTANYLGDIGLHVIKCLWCYLRFHEGQEPEQQQGRWLGELYAQSDKLLGQADAYRDQVLGFVRKVILEEPAGTPVRLEMAQRFWQSLEPALADESTSPELRADLLAMVRQFFLDEPLEFNKIAHREIAGWVWRLWNDLRKWLQELEQGLTEEDEAYQPLQELLREYGSIGHQPEEWGYARELRQLLHRWEKRDADLIALWKRTRQWSLDDFHRIYSELGVSFDLWFFESEVEDEGKEIVDEIIAKGISTDLRPSGPVLVEIDKRLGISKPKYRTIVILRSDGTSLYSTKDLALAKRKFEEHHVDRSIYVVDVGQALYFQQIFKVLELWGFERAKKCHHLAYEIVRLPAGKMSSREGEVVFYDDFFAEALRRARQSVDDKRGGEQYADLPDLDSGQRQQVAEAVALGAVKYGMLTVDNNKQILFDIDSALSFDGQTAPYIQYAHARCCRILEKGGGFSLQQADFTQVELESAEVNLLEAVADFANQVQRAAREYKPLYIAVYLFQLAKSFNDFYRDCPVLRASENLRQCRLALVATTRQTLSNGLKLLGIPAPEYM